MDVLIEVAGMIALVAGVWMIAPAAGLIVAGILLIMTANRPQGDD